MQLTRPVNGHCQRQVFPSNIFRTERSNSLFQLMKPFDLFVAQSALFATLLALNDSIEFLTFQRRQRTFSYCRVQPRITVHGSFPFVSCQLTAKELWLCQSDRRTVVFTADVAEIVSQARFRVGSARMFCRVDVVREVVTQHRVSTWSLPRQFPIEIAHLSVSHPALPSFFYFLFCVCVCVKNENVIRKSFEVLDSFFFKLELP